MGTAISVVPLFNPFTFSSLKIMRIATNTVLKVTRFIEDGETKYKISRVNEDAAPAMLAGNVRVLEITEEYTVICIDIKDIRKIYAHYKAER